MRPGSLSRARLCRPAPPLSALSRRLTLRGRLLEPGREPAAGVTVTIAERSGGKAPAPADYGPIDQEFAGETDIESEGKTAVDTGVEGGFEFAGLRRGDYHLA